MKVKQVYVAPPEEIAAALPEPAPERTPTITKPPTPPSVNNLERDILQRWRYLTLFFDAGGDLDCELLEFGTYWLHVRTVDGERLINKASIEQIAPRDGGAL